MTLKTVHKLTISPVEHPHEEVLAAGDQDIPFWMPLKEVEILIWSVLKRTLQLHCVRIPYAYLIVHTACSKQLAVMVEFEELHSLGVARQLLYQDRFILRRCWLLRDKRLRLLLFLCRLGLCVLIWNHFPNDGLVVTVSRDEGIEGRSRDDSDTEDGVFMVFCELYD
jgi:hypothetical protein